MTKHPVLSIRNVVVALGAVSVLIAVGLAGFGLLGTQRQLDAREEVVWLEKGLLNHNDADAFMDDVRNDVLRALASALGTNGEGAAIIRAELRHHLDGMSAGLGENRTLRLTPDLHDRYERIGETLPRFAGAGQAAVELALTDPAAGSANYETFRHGFSDMEQLMDDTRDVLLAQVGHVRDEAALKAMLCKRMIVTSTLAGIALLALITTIAARIARGITADLAISREEALRLSLHDVLTELPNRTFLAQSLDEALARAERQGGGLAVLCLDLDRFKQVNDTLGHPVGDALLRAVAQRLRACVRQCDTIARLGGDEFAVIQTTAGHGEEVSSLAQQIVESLSRPYDLGGHQVVIGASVGIALAPGDAADPAELLKMADIALYRAKADGRGTFRLFEPAMDRKLQARRLLELDLRRAVWAQEFEVHYQPLVDVSSSRVTAFEALVRWRHPLRGLVPPSDFIPLAEETGLIVPLGAWVLRRACADATRWPSDVRIAVNVSAKQFVGAGLVAAVNAALTASGLAPGRLELEITETALLVDADATLAVLRELRTRGVRIAMDDFGTGYSSLGYLRSFPFDKIKIDRCFIRDIETSPDCKAIVRAVTGLGLNLGIATTAEGVETLAQLDRLRAEGCDQVQGYFFSRPVPAEEAALLLERPWNLPAEAGTRPDTSAAGNEPAKLFAGAEPLLRMSA